MEDFITKDMNLNEETVVIVDKVLQVLIFKIIRNKDNDTVKNKNNINFIDVKLLKKVIIDEGSVIVIIIIKNLQEKGSTIDKNNVRIDDITNMVLFLIINTKVLAYITEIVKD